MNTKLLAHHQLYSIFNALTLDYSRWQDYGEGVQLLDDLCRQITQKERRDQVGNGIFHMMFRRCFT